MFFKAMIIAFSMYSKVPMPKISWEEKSMKYALCFFPIIGAIIGIITYICGNLLLSCDIGAIFFACIMSVIPIFVTGGIHIDGFLDTIDAISSYADKEKKLEILKDSNSGAFAIIGGIVYFILTIGFWSEVEKEEIIFISLGYVISRALSALSVEVFPTAKKTGIVATFKNKADKKIVIYTMLGYIFALSIIILGIDIWYGIGIIGICLICFLYHYFNCIKNFGGITGDTAGYFLQVCELCVLVICVIVHFIKGEV